jgi:predicted transcriptional regulator YdeE
MDYLIENHPAFVIAGTSKKMKKDNADTGIKEFWREIANNDALNKIHEVKTKDSILGGRIVGVCQEHNIEEDEMIYSIGTEYDKNQSVYSLELISISEHKWIQFKFIGNIDDNVNEAKEEVFDFLHHFKKKHDEKIYLEVYTDDNREEDDYEFEIWVPIIE